MPFARGERARDGLAIAQPHRVTEPNLGCSVSVRIDDRDYLGNPASAVAANGHRVNARDAADTMRKVRANDAAMRRLGVVRGQQQAGSRRPSMRRKQAGASSTPTTTTKTFGARTPITVVLAEAHHIVRQGIRCLLEREKDFQVVGETADGLKVTGLVERRKPRVLVVAMALPGLNGLQVIRQVKRRAPETSVILLSMYENERYVVEALQNGASGYVSKRAKGMELIRGIRAVATGGRYLSEPLSKRPMHAWLEQARRGPADAYESLTSREREVFQLVAEGYSSAGIANRLSISPRTAESHRANVIRKLRLTNQVDLIRYALTRGILLAPANPLRPDVDTEGPSRT